MASDLFESMNLPEVKGMKKFYPTTNLYSYERNDNLSYKLNESSDDELPEDEIIEPPGILDPADDSDEEDDEESEDDDDDDELDEDEDDDETGGYIEIEDDDDEDDDDDDKVI